MVAPGANARLQPKSAFSCFPPVHTIGPEGQLRVRLDPFAAPFGSYRYLRVPAVCLVVVRSAPIARVG